MKPSILYDNECRLCCGVVAFLKRNDIKERLRFVPLLSAEGRIMAAEAGVNEITPGTVVFQLDGNFYFRSEAVLRILRTLGRGWQLLYVFVIIPAPVRDSIYDFISHNRYRYFGKGEC
jgi:predicted DCC family thiol-disulfide oxidoreductase YuxK